MGKSFSKIANPDRPVYQQAGLFPVTSERPKYDPFPRIYRGSEATEAAFKEVLNEAVSEGLIGCDLEFSETRITILGIASKHKALAVRWNEDLARLMLQKSQEHGANICGHSTLGAEKQELEKALSITTPVSMYDCSMLALHLTNGDFTKLAGKEENEESGSLGLMGLWTAASLYTDLPMWKDCRGRLCAGPCPRHAVFDYCAVDSWSSLAAFYKMQDEMKEYSVPHSFYRDKMDLADLCIRMQNNGLRIDREWVDHLEKKGQEYKESLFPFDTVNNKPIYKEFNPKSRQQVIAYCKEKGISLEDTTKADVAKALENAAKREGIVAENIKALCEKLEQEQELSKNVDILHRLYLYKSAGKGVKSWFDPRYIGNDGRVHPRFVTTGTCTGRLSSSKPNFMNIPARGWGKAVKQAIIPDEGCDFIQSDFSQLELRVILYLANFDVQGIGKDAFTWLAQNSNGAFEKAGAMLSMSPRDVGKSLAHGGNYGEGLSLLSPSDLIKPHIQKEIEYGARAVYMKKYYPELERDWEFRGGIVSFTGSNLAERLFGDRSLQNRKKALELTEQIYFKSFFGIRRWQIKQLEEAEKGYVKSPVGRYLKLYGTPEEDAKAAWSFLGQGVSADFVQEVMLRYDREQDRVPTLQIHDCLKFQVDKSMSDDKAREVLSLMQEPTKLLPGLSVPGKGERGPNYGQMRPL